MRHGFTPDFCKDAVKAYRMDCMDFMRRVPDGWYDLAVVDPPYGSDNIKGGYTSNKRSRKGSAEPTMYNLSLWKFGKPSKRYFDELIRISKNQIVWGANHFISKMPFDSSCWVVWDKKNSNTGFADCELAWCSFDTAVRKFDFMWNGMLQGNMKNKEQRIHPTQKPVALYKWIFSKYAKPGQRILDTHGGSMSSGIAALEMGFDIDICELDETYFADAVNRLQQHNQLWLAI